LNHKKERLNENGIFCPAFPEGAGRAKALDEKRENDKAQLAQIDLALGAALAAATSAVREPPSQAIKTFEQSRAKLQALTVP
jgi:hypothetical protein